MILNLFAVLFIVCDVELRCLCLLFVFGGFVLCLLLVCCFDYGLLLCFDVMFVHLVAWVIAYCL